MCQIHRKYRRKLPAGRKDCSTPAQSCQPIGNSHGQDTNKACVCSPRCWLHTRWLASAGPRKLPRRSAGYMTGSMFIRGYSAGSYAGMVVEKILAEFPDIEGRAILAAIALPPSLLTNHRVPDNRRVHLIHHADDKLCVWTPSNQDLHMLHRSGFTVTYVTGWRAYLGNAQHNYGHWTKLAHPRGAPFQSIRASTAAPNIMVQL